MYLILLLTCLSSTVALIPSKFIICSPPVNLPSSLDLTRDIEQNVSIQLCNTTFNLTLYPNNYLLAKNVSFDRSIRAQHPKRRFSFIGQVLDEELSSVTLILWPELQIFLFSNETYFYHVSLSNSSSLTLTFSQRRLIQSYPALVNDSVWSNLQQEEEVYQKRTATLRDLHFIYGLLTLRCESELEQFRSQSFCSLALYIDEALFRSTFNSNIQQIYVFIEHFNFLMRTLTQNEYGGFLIKRIALLPPPVVVNNQTNMTTQADMLHTLADNVNLPLKDYCIVHQMILATTGNRSSVIGYQASTNTYDIGGICSSPFRSLETLDTDDESSTSEMNLNTGLSFLIENTTRNVSLLFDGLMTTSYLFLRQMGLNLTLCSVNDTRRRFFQLTKDFSPIVSQCSDLVPLTLHTALQRRAHLCFTHLQIDTNNYSSLPPSILPIKRQTSCQESIDLHSPVIVGSKHRKSPYIKNALNSNNRGEWFEGNIVGMALTFSLLLWIPVSCFVHFCVDETNKKALIEKQQQEMEATASLPSKSPVVEMRSITTKQTQTD